MWGATLGKHTGVDDSSCKMLLLLQDHLDAIWKDLSLEGGSVLEWVSGREVACDWQMLASFMFTL